MSIGASQLRERRNDKGDGNFDELVAGRERRG